MIEKLVAGGLLILGVAAVTALVWLLLAVLLSWAWNGVIPYAFGLPTLGYWQAFKLGVVCTLLIKSTLSTTKAER